jgi:very-short-patch-repair endonuclease
LKISQRKNPRTHSAATKKKISEARKAYLKANPDKVPYLLNHNSKGPSYPERYFKEVFEKEGIALVQYHRVGLFELDFADLERKVDVEIDGGQHTSDQRIVEHDIKRTRKLEALGWRVFRIDWPSYQKKSRSEKNKVVASLRRFLLSS